MSALRKLQRRREEGFTLIELLVVMLILGILAGIAYAAFISQTDKASDSDTRANLDLAYKAARSEAVFNDGNYPGAGALKTAIEADEPGLGTVDLVAAVEDIDGDNVHIVGNPSGTEDLLIGALSDSGTVWTLTAESGEVLLADAGAAAPPAAPSNYEEAVLASSPALYYRLNGVNGTSEVGSSTLIPLNGGPTTGQIGAGATTGNAWSVNNSGFAIPEGDIPTLNDFTLEFFVNPTNIGTSTFTELFSGGPLAGYYFNTFSELTLDVDGTVAVAPPLNNNTWYHVAIVRDVGGNELRAYVDGVLVDTRGLVSSNAIDLIHDIEWGYVSNGHSDNMQGRFDEIALYTSALSGADIAEHYSLRN